MSDFIHFLSYVKSNLATVGISVGLLILYMAGRTFISKVIRRHAHRSHVSSDREIYVRKLVHILFLLITITLLGATWEISLKGLSVYFASIFTVIGVALFATWSVISNLTASIILFFFFPYRIGNMVRVIDGDNSIEGKIEDITLFYIRIRTTDHQVVVYPNNLAIQKPILQIRD
ncbi:MAG: mechanosensitive ion channel [Cytophagales bacterium]|nr:mechanosensitive ion channel [Cytophagales bacterium]